MTQPLLHCRLAAALLVLSTVLSGCVGTPELSPNTDFSVRNFGIRRSNLAAVQDFTLKGRVAERGIAGGRGSIDWQQRGPKLDLRISGPLGVGALAISSDGQRTEIRSKQGVIATRDLQQTMQAELGWSLPLPLVRYWALGVPAPSAPDQQPTGLLLDDVGRALRFDQFGWHIEYDEYQTVNSLQLPRILSLADGQRSFRLVIDEWRGTP